ncbi:uncharacterized protein [Halyomorpha halys]|uniref:uncharacterized protein isoform X1 n=2 Tax=Halyomorpha halys TaxID=286706 RepID=UPI0006D4C805
MGQLVSRKVKQDAETKLTEKRFSAALDIVAYLKENHHEVGIFRYPGREVIRKQILRLLQRGDRMGLGALLRPGVEMESSAAFCSFLQNLKDPLIPCRVQQLISADNQVPDDVVAIDALGLIYQELSGIHLKLVIQTLELFRLINQNSSRNELASISLAVVLLPILMDIKQTWTKRWKDVALILHEMILQSDSWKPIMFNAKRDNVMAGRYDVKT